MDTFTYRKNTTGMEIHAPNSRGKEGNGIRWGTTEVIKVPILFCTPEILSLKANKPIQSNS